MSFVLLMWKFRKFQDFCFTFDLNCANEIEVLYINLTPYMLTKFLASGVPIIRRIMASN